MRPAKPSPWGRTGGLLAGLLLANMLAWTWALVACGGRPVLIGAAVLAYTLGLRHAVDADHIAAIDNVTRKLMQQGQKPLAVGLYFSLGHSTVVVIGCAAIALMSVALRQRLAHLSAFGDGVGVAVSAGFLVLIALANLVSLISLWRALKARRAGADTPPGGLATRLLRPLLGLIERPSHMYGLGFLFGLGFDTASEVALLALAAVQARHAVDPWTVMAFPALFAAGMSLIDTLDGTLMAGAYGWAFIEPRRKLVYNFAVTLVSVIAALVVGAIEILGLVAIRLGQAQGVWRWALQANARFGAIGVGIVAAFLLLWGAAVLLGRPRPILRERAG